jgi:hypothetical protein
VPVRSLITLLNLADGCGRTVGLMNAAHQLGGTTLKRLVLLGSTVAILDSFQDEQVAGRAYTENDWNPVTN